MDIILELKVSLGCQGVSGSAISVCVFVYVKCERVNGKQCKNTLSISKAEKQISVGHLLFIVVTGFPPITARLDSHTCVPYILIFKIGLFSTKINKNEKCLASFVQ